MSVRTVTVFDIVVEQYEAWRSDGLDPVACLLALGRDPAGADWTEVVGVLMEETARMRRRPPRPRWSQAELERLQNLVGQRLSEIVAAFPNCSRVGAGVKAACMGALATQ